MATKVQVSSPNQSTHYSRVAIWRIILGVALVALWELIGKTQQIGEWTSSPGAVGLQIVDWVANGTLIHNAAVTLLEIGLGLAFGLPVGITLGLMLGASRTVREMMLPWLMALYTVPVVAIAPLLILWLGVGLASKVFLVAIVTMFILMWNTFAGARAVSPALLQQFQLLGANPFETFLRCIGPAALPWIIAGARIAIPYSLTGAVAGEMIATQAGLGYLIMTSAQSLDMTGMYAVLVVLMLFGMAFVLAADVLEARLNPNRSTSQTRSRLVGDEP